VLLPGQTALHLLVYDYAIFLVLEEEHLVYEEIQTEISGMLAL
jgi:hypothetical protein